MYHESDSDDKNDEDRPHRQFSGAVSERGTFLRPMCAPSVHVNEFVNETTHT